MRTYGVEIKAVAARVPSIAAGNHDEQWFGSIPRAEREMWQEKWGIEQRYFTDPQLCSPLDITTDVARQALDLARLRALDIDMVVTTTTFPIQLPDHQTYPRISYRIKDRLGLTNAVDFDIQNECSSVMDGIQLAHNAIQTGQIRHALIVAQECSFQGMDRQHFNGMNFGDGYAAVVVSRSENAELGIITQAYRSFPKNHNLATIRWRDEANTETGLRFEMPEEGAAKMGKFVPQTLPRLVKSAFEKAHLTTDDIDFFIFHQPARKLIDAWCALLRIPEHKVIKTMQTFGCSVAAAMPIAFNLALQQSLIPSHAKVVIASPSVGWGFGAQIWQLGELPQFAQSVYHSEYLDQ